MILEYDRRIINGQLITRPPAQQQTYLAAGISPPTKQHYAHITLAGQAITLRAARIIIRPSGKYYRHLSRYLIGICTATGRIYEIFLETVQGLKRYLFKASAWVQTRLLRTLSGLTPGLSMLQKISVLK